MAVYKKIKRLKEANYIHNSKTITLCKNDCEEFFRLLLNRGFFKDQKGSGTCFQVTFFMFLKIKIKINWLNVINRIYPLPELFSEVSLV